MQLKSYDEVDPVAVLELNMNVFQYPLTPELVSTFRKRDRRATADMFRYLVEGGEVLGQAGLLTTMVQTLEGPAKFGMATGICVNPAHGRQGIGRRVMQAVDDWARGEGCRAITLVTNSTWGAHGLYLASGYKDLATAWTAFRPRSAVGTDAPSGGPESSPNAIPRPPVGVEVEPTGLEVRAATEAELPALEVTFAGNTRGLLGFVHRQPDFLQAAIATDEPLLSEVYGVYQDGEPVGFGYAKKVANDQYLLVRGFVLPPSLDLPSAIEALCWLHPTQHVMVGDELRPPVLNKLDNAGYRLSPTWGAVMLRTLDESADWRSLLGLRDRLFYMDRLDFT